MSKFVIEREIPGAAALTPEDLQSISRTSCGVLQKVGPSIQTSVIDPTTAQG
jgi:hypothetical protein